MFPGIFWPWPKLCPVGTSFPLPFCWYYNRNIYTTYHSNAYSKKITYLIHLMPFLYNQLISKRLLQENKLGKKGDKFKLELTFVLNKWFSSCKKLKEKFWQLTYINVLIVVVFINMIKSIAIVNFMMESVIPAPLLYKNKPIMFASRYQKVQEDLF